AGNGGELRTHIRRIAHDEGGPRVRFPEGPRIAVAQEISEQTEDLSVVPRSHHVHPDATGSVEYPGVEGRIQRLEVVDELRGPKPRKGIGFGRRKAEYQGRSLIG